MPLPRLPQIPEGTGVIKSDLSQIWIVPAMKLTTAVPLFGVVS